MNFVGNTFLDGCAKVEESYGHAEGDVEEESLEPSSDKYMILWDMVPSVNMIKDDEVIKKILTFQIRSKGIVNQQQPIVSQPQ